MAFALRPHRTPKDPDCPVTGEAAFAIRHRIESVRQSPVEHLAVSRSGSGLLAFISSVPLFAQHLQRLAGVLGSFLIASSFDHFDRPKQILLSDLGIDVALSRDALSSRFCRLPLALCRVPVGLPSRERLEGFRPVVIAWLAVGVQGL